MNDDLDPKTEAKLTRWVVVGMAVISGVSLCLGWGAIIVPF